MIVHNLEWSLFDIPQDTGTCAETSVDHYPSHRVSELLGPDGEPLLVPFPRRAIGFDLRKRAK
jgi:hypothetical protein